MSQERIRGSGPDSPSPTPRPPNTRPDVADGVEVYNRVAETVGMVPSLRVKDNLIQLIVVMVGTLIGALTGFIIAKATGEVGESLLAITGLGAALGFIVFGVLSGIVLMVIGWVRAITGWKKKRRE